MWLATEAGRAGRRIVAWLVLARARQRPVSAGPRSPDTGALAPVARWTQWFLRVLSLAATGALVAYGVTVSTGTLDGLLFAGVLVVALAVLGGWSWRSGVAARTELSRAANGGLMFLPALLVIFFSFRSGGFFPDSVALGGIAITVLLVIRLATGGDPLRSIGPGALVPLVGLCGLAGWALLSQFWSHAPGRATVGFNRDLLYTLTFALFVTVGRTRMRLLWAVRGLALAMTLVAAVALLSRVAPGVLATAPDPLAGGRLEYPLTYWNALGVLCAIASVFCLHLAAADDRSGIRVLAAGALPVLGATLLMTYSRGGVAVAVIGLVGYAVLGRPRGLLSAVIATAPGTAIAIATAYDATLLSRASPTSAAAVREGHHVGLVVLACVAFAVALRAALGVLDRLLEGEHSPFDRHRRALRAAGFAAAVAAVAAALALGAPAAIAQRWNQFLHEQNVPAASLVRARLSSSSNHGRIELWTIALNAFRAHPIDGTGAETFEILFYEHRAAGVVDLNAHSLYVETLSELGLVGLGFVLLFVLGTLVGLAPVGRGRDRALYAALFSAGLAWSLHAGVDWDWQMPAVSLWFAALGGLALGRPRWRSTGTGRPTFASQARLAIVAAVVVGACVFPTLVLGSQVRLNEATAAYRSGDCTRAAQMAQRSISILGTRARAWQIEALCDVRRGWLRRARAVLRSGLAVDPRDWQLEAALAAVTAAVGSDARFEAAVALGLNPANPRIRKLARALAAGPSVNARRAARNFLSQQTLIVSG